MRCGSLFTVRIRDIQENLSDLMHAQTFDRVERIYRRCTGGDGKAGDPRNEATRPRDVSVDRKWSGAI